MEKDTEVGKKTTWSTWEELLLAFAVKRHGFKDWESVAMELQTRSTLPALFTAKVCKEKYRDLRRRFINYYNNNNSSYDGENINDDDDVEEDGDGTIPWIEELRQLRVAELKQEVQHYDLSIQSLQSKMKKMEEEREQSLKEESLNDGQKPDLDDVIEERSQNDKNSGADAKPAESTGKSVSSEESSRENRSFNESNSTENRGTGVKHEEPEPVETGAVKPVEPVKPVNEQEDSCNDSSSDRHDQKKVARDSGDLRDSESKEEEGTKESSDVQSTATLTKRKRQRGGGDTAETGSPAIGIKSAAKSEPLIEFLDIIRSHKRGSVFKRRLDSQKTDKYKSIIRQHMDLEMVQARIDDGSYCSCPAKFYLDLLLIFNNAIVYFPKSSPESTAANELRGIVMEELKKNRSQSKDLSPGPEVAHMPLKIQPKPELERSDSLLAKHKSTAPIVVCRKRSSISAKAAASGSNSKPEKQAETKPPFNPKPPIKSSSNEEDSSIKLGIKEKPVTGVRSMRRSSKGRPNNASQPNNNQNTTIKQSSSNVEKKEETKPEKKKEETKKRGAAADFLKRIKKNSPTKGPLVEALKNPPEEVVVKGNKREQQKKKVDERKETPVRRGGGGGSGAVKEEGSPSKKIGSRGRPPKRGGGGKETVQEKRGRENSEKQEDSSKRPKKRTRR